VITRKMTPAEVEKYGAIQGDGKRPVMAGVEKMMRKEIEEKMYEKKIEKKRLIELCKEHGFGEKAYKEIADILGVKWITVSTTVSRMQIKKLIEAEKKDAPAKVADKVMSMIGPYIAPEVAAEVGLIKPVGASGTLGDMLRAIDGDICEPVDPEPVTVTDSRCILPTPMQPSLSELDAESLISYLMPKKVPKVYISTGWGNKTAAIRIGKIVEAFGGQISVPWWTWEDADRAELLKQYGEQEIEGIRECDLFVCMLPGERGTHTELGVALTCGKRVMLYTPHQGFYDSIPFYFCNGVQLVAGEIEDLIIEIHKVMEAVG